MFGSILTGIIDEEIDATMKELKYVESFFAHDPTMVAKAKSIVDIAPLGGYDEGALMKVQPGNCYGHCFIHRFS